MDSGHRDSAKDDPFHGGNGCSGVERRYEENLKKKCGKRGYFIKVSLRLWEKLPAVIRQIYTPLANPPASNVS